MTPADKARELIDKMRPNVANATWYAKKCVLILIEEVLEESIDREYWLAVKDEVNKL